MKISLKKILFMLMFATCAQGVQRGEVANDFFAVGQWAARAAVAKFRDFVNKEITTSRVLAVGGILAVGYYAWKKNKQGVPSQIPTGKATAQSTEPATARKNSQTIVEQSVDAGDGSANNGLMRNALINAAEQVATGSAVDNPGAAVEVIEQTAAPKDPQANVVETSLLSSVAQGAEVLSTAEEVPSTSVGRDSQVESDFNVQKIHALVQGKMSYGSYGEFWYNTCSCYAIFFADLLIKHFEGRKASHGVDDLNETVFQSNLAFAGTSDLFDYKRRKSIQPCFLTTFNLVEEFRAIDIAAKTALTDARVGEIAKKVNPKITVVLKPEAIASRLKDSNGYQVLICKSKNDHWTAFGIDYLEDKIYFVDSLGYLNYKNQKYSSDNIEIISKIRAGMSALKDPAVGIGGGGGAV
jgi:hypothetical protein